MVQLDEIQATIVRNMISLIRQIPTGPEELIDCTSEDLSDLEATLEDDF